MTYYLQLWTSFSPIADYTAEYYAIDDTKVNWLSMVFMVVSIPVGLFVVWFLDTIGLRANVRLKCNLTYKKHHHINQKSFFY